MSCEHLTDACGAALMRLDIVYMLWRHPFEGVSFLLHPLLSLRPSLSLRPPPLSLRDIPYEEEFGLRFATTCVLSGFPAFPLSGKVPPWARG